MQLIDTVSVTCLRHAGAPVVRGVRIILVGFVDPQLD